MKKKIILSSLTGIGAGISAAHIWPEFMNCHRACAGFLLINTLVLLGGGLWITWANNLNKRSCEQP